MKESLVVALTALVLVGSPGRSEAGIGDLIWELSGPQMVGFGINCRYDLKGNWYCEWSASAAATMQILAVDGSKLPFWSKDRVFWSWGAAGYVSTGKNNEYEDDSACPEGEFPCKGKEIEYRAFDHRMISFEPTVDYAVGALHEKPIFVSAGVTIHSVWNRDAKQFWKAGFKIAQVEIPVGKGVSVSGSLRYYWDGFGVDEFGKGVRPAGNRPSEWTWGFGASLPLFRKGS